MCSIGDTKKIVGKNTKRYKERWNKGTVIENGECKFFWDLEHHLRTTTTARRPDVAIDYENKNKILLIDIACPSKNQCWCEACRDATKKSTSHIRDQRERWPDHNVMIIPIVIGCLGGGRVMLQIKLRDWYQTRRKQAQYRTKWWRQYYLKVKV